MAKSSRLWDSIVSHLGNTSQKFAAGRKRLKALKPRSLQLEKCEDRLLLSIAPVLGPELPEEQVPFSVDAVIEYASSTPVKQLDIDWGDSFFEKRQNMLAMLDDPRWVELCKENEAAAMDTSVDTSSSFIISDSLASSLLVAGPALPSSRLSSESMLLAPSLLGGGGMTMALMAGGPTTLSVSGGTVVDEGTPITLTVDVNNLADTLTQWTIDWGDETVTVTPPASGDDWGDGVVQVDSDTWTFTHTYPDGYDNYYVFIDAELTDTEENSTTIDVYYPLILGDANISGTVDGSDVTIISYNWQATNATWNMGDFNGDGVVDGSDVTILSGHWQQSTSCGYGGIAVENIAPTLTLTSGQVTVSAGATHGVTLSATGDPGDDTITSVTFDWGDGQTSTGTKPASGNDWGNNITQNPDGSWTVTHTYTSAGTYDITASVTDEDGTWGDSQYQGNLLVSTLADETDSDYTYGDLSLREALSLANQNVDAATIVFDADLFNDGTTPGTITLGGTQLDITSDVTIQGPGAGLLTISAAGLSRVFEVNSAEANFFDLTITGGSTAGDAGGIMFDSATGSVTNSIISENIASGSGGGIGVYGSSTVTIATSTFIGNSATRGAGLDVYNATGTIRVDVENSTFSGNVSTNHGGGVYVDGSNVTVDIVNSTLAGNDANTGGGLYRGTTGTVHLSNSIVALNTASSGSNVEGTLATDVNNLVDTDPLFVRAPSDGGDGWGDDPTTTTIDESLNDDYGDLRLTYASPAVNAGDDTTASGITTDLDGNARTIYQTVDIGAYEYNGDIFVSTLSDDDTVHGANDYTYENLSLREAIELGIETITFDPALFLDANSNPLPGTITLNGTQLELTNHVTITGPGVDLLTIDANEQSRVFYIHGAGVTLSGITITGGSTSDFGGGIYVDGYGSL